MTEAEKKERAYLKHVIDRAGEVIATINEAIALKKEEVDYMNNHMEDHKRDMDHLEKNAMRETIFNYTLQGEHAQERKKRLLRLRRIPYFGRMDFKENGNSDLRPIYVGVHNFQDDEAKEHLVHDWRAPISSMFYDYETGPAAYRTEIGEVRGTIGLKRQFRIRNGELEYMMDSDLTIHDEVLQQELSQTSSSKMRNIVATIQREQNAIIRNEDSRHLIIQGVAGSGKTSIALHRIAFLLYRFKETISSSDILIISPNKVFASYISNVLPELGEATVTETGLEDIADILLEHKFTFQTFFEQVTELLERPSEELIARICFKSDTGLLKRIDEYLVHLENEGLMVTDIFVAKKPVPEWFIRETFQKYHRLPLLDRFNEVVRDIVDNIFRYYRIEVQGKERTELHKTVRAMFPSTNLRALYKGFYDWLGRPNLYSPRKGSQLEWSDVYPLIYLKMKLENIRPFQDVKHLVIDEMQDYSAVQYRILSQLYPCRKTILGDINQSVNPFSSSNVAVISDVFGDALCMTMLKSYRSTYEIVQFSKRISRGIEVEPIERHGDEPTINAMRSEKDETAFIRDAIGAFRQTDRNAMGIICKTQKQTDRLLTKLKDLEGIKVLDSKSAGFSSGVVLTTAHLAKGLEFDHVLMPQCTEENYRTEADRQMLYVACTRAMHRLDISHTGTLTKFI